MRCLNCHTDGISITVDVCPRCSVYLPSLLRDVLPYGTLLHNDAYRIDYALGCGGFGITYRAVHVALEDLVAIKEFYPREYVVRDSTTGSLIIHPQQEEIFEQDLQQFKQEGYYLKDLHHPGIVRIRDLFIERGTAYLVMELISGRSLRSELDIQPERKFPLERVNNIVRQLVEALGAVHLAGIYHLDIKPENVLLAAIDKVTLIDFGAAKHRAKPNVKPQFDHSYAAPELFRGQEVGMESDLYELGMMVHELLTGKRPPSALERLKKKEIDVLSPDLTEPWRGLLEQALFLQKEKRPRSVKAWWDMRLQVPSSMDVSNVIESSEDFPSQIKMVLPPKAVMADSTSVDVSNEPSKDFFISYAEADFSWAKWIKWQLEQSGYSTILLSWGVQADSKFPTEIQKSLKRANRVIVVLSPDYMEIFSSQTKFIDMFKQKRTEDIRRIIPVYVRECEYEVKKMLALINKIDLSSEDEGIASAMLLAGVRDEGIVLITPPIFPGGIRDKAPTFPGKEFVDASPSKTSKSTRILSYANMNHGTLIQQIHDSFEEGNWPHVIRKVDILLKIAPNLLSFEICCKQGRALLKIGAKERASEAFQTAIALSPDDIQRLQLLEECYTILESLNQRDEILGIVREALYLAPDSEVWYARLTRLQISKKSISQNQFESPSLSSAFPTKKLNVFFSYCHRDKDMRDRLGISLSAIERHKVISSWYDGEIDAGNKWAQEIDRHISQANIILLLVSPDFIASKYCYDIEMKRALERHEKGDAYVLPIIIRPAQWQKTNFSHLQVLPTAGKPITTWKNRDEAFLSVAEGILRVANRLTGGSLSE